MNPRRTLTAIQGDYVDTVLSAKLRWSHRKDGGHSHRTIGKAIKKLRREMKAWGYTESFITLALSDANDIVELELRSM